MYSPHAQLTLPPDHQTIWRYISFTKFVSMLTDQSLFFCRVDRLQDKWEGVYPQGMVDYWSRTFEEVSSNDGKNYTLKDLITKRIIPSHFVNCWYISEFESDAMWRLYSQNDEGIAIRSTIGRLKKSLEKTTEQVWIGKVHYIDYNQWEPPDQSSGKSQFVWIEPFFWKRISFINCSTPEQVIEVANLYLRGQKGLVLLCINPEKVKSPVRYEDFSGTNQFFPHIYGGLNMDAVIDVFIFEPEMDGSFLLPKELSGYC
jgi:uncharacterized protein (DUF952 family)